MADAEKERLRAEGLARRDAEPEREAKGEAIREYLRYLPIFGRARTVATYVGVKSEVPTLPLIEEMLAGRKRVLVPAVVGSDVRLVRIDSTAELVAAPFGLLEPGAGIRDRLDRRAQPAEVDLFLVPGVVFDRKGGRIGYGKGFYDRILARARAGTPTVGLGFEAQVVPSIPMGPADIHIKHLVTERMVYTFERPRGIGR